MKKLGELTIEITTFPSQQLYVFRYLKTFGIYLPPLINDEAHLY